MWNKKLKYFGVTTIFIAALAVFTGCVADAFCDFYFQEEGVAFDAINYFWSENFRFWQLPHFKWHNDFFVYPFGMDVTFIFWAFEMNLWGALWHKLFGIGGCWAQLYYVFSLAVTYFLSYILIARRKGHWWGSCFAFALTFCNYAAICKYPVHFSHCIVHWGIISVLTDVIMVEKYWNKEKFSALFVQGKVLLLLLVLGLEMGYIAGLACCSFLVTVIYILLMQCIQDHSVVKFRNWLKTVFNDIFSSYLPNKWNFVFSALIILVSWIYIPIILQILFNAPNMSRSAVWQTYPLRIFLPIFPGFNPATLEKAPFAHTDTIYAWSAGWAFLSVFLFGMIFRFRENCKKWLPFVLLLLALMGMYYCPVITWFPAFKFVRIPERFSPYLILFLLTPVYFQVSETAALKTIFRRKLWRYAAIFWVILFLVEFITAYTSTFLWSKKFPVRKFPDSYRQAFETIRDLPGEAIFFFPFAVYGGDGNGFYNPDVPVAFQMQLAALAGKKINAAYCGRMSRVLVETFAASEMQYVFKDRVFTERHWEYLTDFFKRTNFAAVVLYTDLLPEEMVREFHRRIGEPIIKFQNFSHRCEVIPLPESLRTECVVDPYNLADFLSSKCDLISKEKFKALPDSERKNLIEFNKENPNVDIIRGLYPIESWGRWSKNECVKLNIALPVNARDIVFDCRLKFNLFWSKNGTQGFNLQINDQEKIYRTFNSKKHAAEQFIDFSILPSERNGYFTLSIKVDQPTATSELIKTIDHRKLGIGLVSLEMKEVCKK